MARPSRRSEIPDGILAWDLGAGESAVLAYALDRLGALAIIDDLQARRCAEAHGIPLRGTVGLILRARRLELIPTAREALNRVRQAGLLSLKSGLFRGGVAPTWRTGLTA